MVAALHKQRQVGNDLEPDTFVLRFPHQFVQLGFLLRGDGRIDTVHIILPGYGNGRTDIADDGIMRQFLDPLGVFGKAEYLGIDAFLLQVVDQLFGGVVVTNDQDVPIAIEPFAFQLAQHDITKAVKGKPKGKEGNSRANENAGKVYLAEKEKVGCQAGKPDEVSQQRFAGKVFKRKQGLLAVNIGKVSDGQPQQVEYHEEFEVIGVVLGWDLFIEKQPAQRVCQVEGEQVEPRGNGPYYRK